jgi:anti-sigma regulatory factor (Ser/Thr protein kinase)
MAPAAGQALPERGTGDAADDPPSPAHLAGLRRAARASLRAVPSEVAEEVVLAVDEAATNAILHGWGAGQPVEVAVEVTADWVEATILDHGPARPPPPQSAGGDPEALGTHGRACGCCVGWSTRYGWSVSSTAHA